MSTKRFSRAGAWLIATGLMLGGTTAATAGGGDTKQSTKQTQGMGQKTTSINGSVVGVKAVKLKGTDMRHLVAAVKTDEGKRKLIDLGPREEAQTLNIETGDQLQARGRQANVGGRTVLIANQARAGDRSLTIDRSQQRQHFDSTMRQAQSKICPAEEG